MCLWPWQGPENLDLSEGACRQMSHLAFRSAVGHLDLSEGRAGGWCTGLLDNSNAP